jgi:hypothetical protein
MTYFAIVLRAERFTLGYVIDAYPEERAAYIAEFSGSKEKIIGEYSDVADARMALALAMAPTAGGMH